MSVRSPLTVSSRQSSAKGSPAAAATSTDPTGAAEPDGGGTGTKNGENSGLRSAAARETYASDLPNLGTSDFTIQGGPSARKHEICGVLSGLILLNCPESFANFAISQLSKSMSTQPNIRRSMSGWVTLYIPLFALGHRVMFSSTGETIRVFRRSRSGRPGSGRSDSVMAGTDAAVTSESGEADQPNSLPPLHSQVF